MRPYRILGWWALVGVAGTAIIAGLGGWAFGEDWGPLVAVFVVLVVLRWTLVPWLISLVTVAVLGVLGDRARPWQLGVALLGPPSLSTLWFVATADGGLL